MNSDEHMAKKSILNLYGLFGLSIILCVVPYVSAAILCLLFFVVLLTAAYVMRGRAEEHSLIHNHTTYIIRTLWIGALISFITTLCASFYMLGTISYEPFQPCANKIAQISIDALQAMGPMEIYPMVEPCVESFISFNKKPLMFALAIAAIPVLGYLAYRFIKGVARAMKGYRLADPKSWL